MLNRKLLSLTMQAVAFAVLLTASALSQAAAVIYERVDFIEGTSFFTEQLTLEAEGTYTVSLTDFEFPTALESMGLAITTADSLIVSLLEAGQQEFEAKAGTYFLSIFGRTDTLGLFGTQITLDIGTSTSPVPVPAAIWLMASALIGLTRFKKNRTL